MLTNELLNRVACPVCKGKLDEDRQKDTLHCNACRLIFPVLEGIPLLLAEKAIKLDKYGLVDKLK